MGPNQRQNKGADERIMRPNSQTTSKQKLGVAFGSRAAKYASQQPSANDSISVKKTAAVVDHKRSSRKDVVERVVREDSSPPKGFARLQQMAGRVQPVVISHDEDTMSQGIHGMGFLAQSSRASELRGESEYLKFSGEHLSEDQLDKLMRQNREVRRR